MELIYFLQFVVSNVIEAALMVLVGAVALKGAYIGATKIANFLKR